MVYDLDVSNDGTKLYVAGSFTTIGGVTRQRIARLNLPSGTVDTAWTANANAIVATVSSDNSNVYVGGDFTTIKYAPASASPASARRTATSSPRSPPRRTSGSARARSPAVRLIVGGEVDLVNSSRNRASSR